MKAIRSIRCLRSWVTLPSDTFFIWLASFVFAHICALESYAWARLILAVVVLPAFSVGFDVGTLSEFTVSAFQSEAFVNTFATETNLPVVRTLLVSVTLGRAIVVQTLLPFFTDEGNFMAGSVEVVISAIHTSLTKANIIGSGSVITDSADVWCWGHNVVKVWTFLLCWSRIRADCCFVGSINRTDIQV